LKPRDALLYQAIETTIKSKVKLTLWTIWVHIEAVEVEFDILANMVLEGTEYSASRPRWFILQYRVPVHDEYSGLAEQPIRKFL